MYDTETMLYIKKIEDPLVILYPEEACYCSKCSLWSRALSNGKVSRRDYDMAKAYYGKLWTYVGD